jgi:xanthine dehydrogenase accessory factor
MVADSLSTHHRGILAHVEALAEQGRAFTLCLVVHTTGSTYRKAGALAVVERDGSRRGVISGGCLESDLESAALGALQEQRARLIVFDTNNEDDDIFGSGSGCRGRMQVLLLPVAAAARHPLCTALLAADRAHQTLKAALVTRGPSIGGGVLWGGPRQIEFAPCDASVRDLRASPVGEYPLPDQGSCAVFVIKPSPRILLIGAGPEAPCMIRVASVLGWHLTVCDHREGLLTRHAAGADRTVCARPAAALESLSDQAFDACIVMTHTLANDREALGALSVRQVPFVGLLGPARRRDALLSEVSPAALAALHGRLHAPVGIKLGGYGPEVLALSVCAELQRFVALDVNAPAKWAAAQTTQQRRA